MEDIDTRQLVDALIGVMHKNGSLKSAAVEQAFRNVPRHLFLPNEPLERVYTDSVILVKKSADGESTSASSQPSIMAVMLEQLDLQPGMRVLEIGAGSGYNAALMAYLVGETGSVITIDIQPDLIEQARINLNRAGFDQVQAIAADGGEGYPPAAPYDRIILTVSSGSVAPAWREQLMDGGRLVLPLSISGPWAMKSIAFDRREDELISASLWDCGFMPLQGAFASPPPNQISIGAQGRLVFTSPLPLPVDEQTLSQWLAERNSGGAEYGGGAVHGGGAQGGGAQDGGAVHGGTVGGGAFPTGVKTKLWDFLSSFHTWLNIQSPQGVGILSAQGDAVEEIVSLALIALGGQEKQVETFLKILPGSAAAITRPPGAKIEWFNPEKPPHKPARPFEVYVQQLGPSPAAAQYLVRMIQAWDASGRPGTSRMRVRALPAAKPIPTPLAEGEFLVERPWTNFIIWYEK
jgi:protein-L-isoaspartate(D-aspartate) O-methyltransferase